MRQYMFNRLTYFLLGLNGLLSSALHAKTLPKQALQSHESPVRATISSEIEPSNSHDFEESASDVVKKESIVQVNTGIWDYKIVWSSEIGYGSAHQSDACHLLLLKENQSPSTIKSNLAGGTEQAENGENIRRKEELFQTELADNALLIADQTGNFYGISPKNGKILWQKNRNTEAGFRPISAQICLGPISTEKYLFLISHHGELFCFNRSSSPQLLWSKNLEHTLGGRPVVHRGRVFIQDAQQNIYALNAANGNILWHYPLIDANPLTPVFFGYKATGTPLVLSCGSILALDDQGYLSLINPVTGEKLERKNLILIKGTQIGFEEGAVLSLAQPKQDKLYIYIPTLQGIFALYQETINNAAGLNVQEAWQKTEDKIWQDIELVGNRLYYATLNGEIVALNKNTGEELWRKMLVSGGTKSLGAPKLFSIHNEDNQKEDILLVTDRSGFIHGLNPDNGEVILSRSIVSASQGLYETCEQNPDNPNQIFVSTLKGATLCVELVPAESSYFVPHPLDKDYNAELHEFENEIN